MDPRMTGYGTWECDCKQCHHPFEAKRDDAKFCSDACRNRWARDGKMASRHKNDALYAIRALMALSKDRPDLKDVINQAFREIDEQIKDAKRLRPDSDELALMDMFYQRANKRNVVYDTDNHKGQS